MTRPDRWNSTDIAQYTRDPRHYTGDGRSEDQLGDTFPPLLSQREIDGHMTGPDSFAVAVFAAGSFACFIAGFILGSLIW